ncbi:MAG: GGDEF domain-containing protein [Kangiellaceae bacterium]|nr:GGDEF domain-containing protein [Kangiellaceae bacterium]
MAVRKQYQENLLLDASDSGERLIALFRLLIYSVIGIIPIAIYLLTEDSRPELVITAFASLVAIAFAVLVYILTLEKVRWPKLAWYATFFDISSVSIILLLFALFGKPLVATNSMIIWQFYGVMIFISTLRLNYRITAFAGVICIVQYFLLTVFIAYRWQLTQEGVFSESYGSFYWPVQIARILILVAITAVSVGFVIRSRRLVIYSGTDSLTGLKNRAYFEYKFSSLLKDSSIHEQPITLAFLDMDHFKSINDRYGHATGDLALQKTADVLRKHAERSHVARWGGEEFVMMWKNTNKQQALEIINDIRFELRHGFEVEDNLNLKLKLSAGLVETPRESDNPHDLINIADDRMLMAKRKGRDQVVLE